MKIKYLFVSLFMMIGSAMILKAQSREHHKKYNLPYKNTYVKEPYVTENEYRIVKPYVVKPQSFHVARQILPVPIWKGHEKEIEMYWAAWQLAVEHIRLPEEGSGFVSGYLDTAYNGNMFMWDSSFILMFARYGARFYPFQQTLDNFYAKQHPDGFICREIKADGADCFERYDPVSTGPNLMPWCEMVYFQQYGDVNRLHKVFPVLCAYYKWLQLNRTWQDGSYWSSGWGTGMDNMPRVKSKYNPIFSHGHMSWLDTNLQQIFTANLLLKMGFYIERWQEVEDFEDEARYLSKYVNEKMWDKKSGFLYDRYADGSLCETKGIGAFWALLADVLDSVRVERLIDKLEDPQCFSTKYRVPSLSVDHPKFRENGRYWQGGIWPGTNYMVLRGLDHVGKSSLARDIALNHYEQVLSVYEKTGTFYEYYAPNSDAPGLMARKDFVGWTGLTPIAELIEYVIGLKANYPENRIEWRVNLLEENGIDKYPFGPDGLISLKAEQRSDEKERPRLVIHSNVQFVLHLIYGDDEELIEVVPHQTIY